jgi:signal transduction histidine kinase
MNCSATSIEVVISNQGPGIPSDKLPNIFDFGMRVDQVKSTTGYGIGLPLAQRILKIHNASIRIESDPGIVTRVLVVFEF